MIYKIQNFTQMVPLGAHFIGVVKENNDILTVRYFHDEKGLSEATNFVSRYSTVMDKPTFGFLIGENLGLEVAGLVGRTVGKLIAGAVNFCLTGTTKSNCKTLVFAVATEEDQRKNTMGDSDKGKWSTVAELVFPEDLIPDAGDVIGIRNDKTGKTEKVVIVKLFGEGLVADWKDELEEFYDGEFDASDFISENPNPGFIISVNGKDILNIPAKPLNGDDDEFAEDLDEAAEPMKKLKDTTKVAGQNKRTLRRGDKSKAGKKIDPEKYVDDGDDSRGAMRFPHSELEQEFADLHGEPEIYDHPANTDKWFTTVNNKAINQRMKSANEDIAPLSSKSL